MSNKKLLWIGLLVGSAAVVTGLTQQALVGVKIDQQGQLGVGTESPQAALHVVGNTLTTGVAKGAGSGGQNGNAFVLQGFSLLGTPSEFSIIFDDLNHGKTPQAIQIMNTSLGIFKTFIVDHPADAQRYLVHASLEGPEGAVYYRGNSRLEEGSAEVRLPEYFEAFTRKGGRTVLLTNVDGFDRLAVQSRNGAKILDGTFHVVSDNPKSSQAFDWEVKAVRSDGPPLEVEPARDQVEVGGFGPYTFALPGAPSQTKPQPQ